MSSKIEGSTTNVQEPYYALLAWTGLASSEVSCVVMVIIYLIHDYFRVKEKLRSGEMAVSGDQWPVFLYYGYNYDPEDPWNGLFRSTLLISVC